MIFSSAFRRLQNKTQIFPLPGNTFVHNRLTHSLEVASVGRSLGSLTGAELAKSHIGQSSTDAIRFYNYQLSNVIAAACLAHDIGNPSFGHSGESAISSYFKQNKNTLIDNVPLIEHFKKEEWLDLITFEGNANAFRLLTQHFIGKYEGGMGLTYATLAAILKYPCEASATDKSQTHRKKYGFFQSEKEIFESLVHEFGLQKDNSTDYISTYRHPFVYLVEAADDICYRIIDLEDAHRINILTYEQISYYYLTVLDQLDSNDINLNKINKTLNGIGDNNEKVAYLRSKAIGSLVNSCANIFIENQNSVLKGEFGSSIMDQLDKSCPIMDEIQKDSIKYIYNHHSVIELEITGYKVLSELLNIFAEAVLVQKPNGLQRKTLLLIPPQFSFYKTEGASAYQKTMGVLDFISGMTDGYATSLYRKLMGIDIAHHN
jgi:dGTPase